MTISRSQSRHVALTLPAWLAVWAFWLWATHDHHPTFAIALIVTTSLVVAYAAAGYVNHLVLIPRLWRTGRRGRYAGALLGTMVALTAVPLSVIRVSYLHLWGPDADLYGAYKHFAIDLFGMAVHLVVAAGVVWAARPNR